MTKKWFTLAFALGAFIGFNPTALFAWDYEGHHMVNELALTSLPKDFGIDLTPALRGRIAFLAGEPDRWRNVPDLPLKHFNGPDHYLDVEDLKLCGLSPVQSIWRQTVKQDTLRGCGHGYDLRVTWTN